jgi:hypothetical protein
MAIIENINLPDFNKDNLSAENMTKITDSINTINADSANIKNFNDVNLKIKQLKEDVNTLFIIKEYIFIPNKGDKIENFQTDEDVSLVYCWLNSNRTYQGCKIEFNIPEYRSTDIVMLETLTYGRWNNTNPHFTIENLCHQETLPTNTQLVFGHLQSSGIFSIVYPEELYPYLAREHRLIVLSQIVH